MTFQRWELDARIALADIEIDPADVDTLMAEARAHHQDSGGSATDTLGSPQDFAAAIMAERAIDPRARADAGGLTAGERIQVSLLTLGVVGVLGLLLAPRRGLALPVTVAGLAGAVLLGVGPSSASIQQSGPRGIRGCRPRSWWPASPLSWVRLRRSRRGHRAASSSCPCR
jgi:hypothetical protein